MSFNFFLNVRFLKLIIDLNYSYVSKIKKKYVKYYVNILYNHSGNSFLSINLTNIIYGLFRICINYIYLHNMLLLLIILLTLLSIFCIIGSILY